MHNCRCSGRGWCLFVLFVVLPTVLYIFLGEEKRPVDSAMFFSQCSQSRQCWVVEPPTEQQQAEYNAHPRRKKVFRPYYGDESGSGIRDDQASWPSKKETTWIEDLYR